MLFSSFSFSFFCREAHLGLGDPLWGFEMGGEDCKRGLLQMGNFCLAVMRMHNNTNKLDGVGHGSAFIQKLETERKKKKKPT